MAASEDTATVTHRLRPSLTAEERRQVGLNVLSKNPREHMDAIDPHGLLYLPHPYVVPGGRFNEMYG